MKHIHSRKGVTILEVVIALTIITIISGVTLTMIVMSTGVETKAANALIVNNASENAIECYRFASANQKNPLSVAQLFFECLLETGNYEVGSKLNNEQVFEPNSTGMVEKVSDMFRLISGGCTILITPQHSGGFKFEAFNAQGEQLQHFYYPTR